ncbi:MAG: hypothetical protein A3D28_05350 [Omnitrophica bacterium RIFCSPHIGHO2_02_FULL_63_14]|nr:MAG: hypothetical protein A3D28_05350 [Omnitrophica bacterium RIFCSPHIGHO2_02_FULL_63_14]
MDIKGKTALVTGAAVRVGRQIALTLAARGANILLHYNSSGDEAKKTRAEIQAFGVKCELLQADIGEADEVRRMAEEAHKRFPVVEILVNNASAYYPTPLEKVKETDWDILMAGNLKGAFFLSQALGLRMREGSGGKIINIADWTALRPYKHFAPYSAAKGGLITLTKSLARDLAPKVYANAVAPGPILPPADMPQSEVDAVAKLTALGRWGGPEAVANAVIFLLENDYINGTVLVVDGGRSIL